MADYIERSKASELLCKIICGSERALCVSTCENCRQKQMVELYKIPAANVREDVHGEWEPGNPVCPVCGESKFKGLDADIWADWQPPFCPNCGARMGGKFK